MWADAEWNGRDQDGNPDRSRTRAQQFVNAGHDESSECELFEEPAHDPTDGNHHQTVDEVASYPVEHADIHRTVSDFLQNRFDEYRKRELNRHAIQQRRTQQFRPRVRERIPISRKLPTLRPRTAAPSATRNAPMTPTPGTNTVTPSARQTRISEMDLFCQMPLFASDSSVTGFPQEPKHL